MKLPTRTLVQCADCGGTLGVHSDGEVEPCQCGAWRIVPLTVAPWRVSAYDYELMRQNRIDPETDDPPVNV